MLINYKYTDKEVKELLNNIVILVDTREQKNMHITSLFDKNKIQYEQTKLDFGDYSFKLKKSELIPRDIYFDKEIVIERKKDLEELSGNFTTGRTQFENELLRKNNCKFILMIETATINHIFDKKYKTEFNPKSFIGTLLSFQHRYNIQITFIEQFHSWNYIYKTFYYYLRENIK